MSMLPQFPPHSAPALLQGRLAGFVWAAILAPAYMVIAFSIMGGVPPRGDMWAWAFVCGLTAFPPVAVVLDALAWRLRMRLEAPGWWTLSRHRNADKAVWMAAILAFVLIPQSLIGWPAATHWAICWLGLIPLVFLIGEVFDGAFGRMQEGNRPFWDNHAS